MAFIRIKLKKGNPYYYIVENYRVGSKTRQRILEYIGPPDKLAGYALLGWESKNKVKQESDAHPVLEERISFKSYSHGAGIALFRMAQSLNVEKIMDEVFPSKTIKGYPRSRVLLLAMIHRAIDPGSKRAFCKWAEQTSLPYHLQFSAKDLDSAAFWEAMDGIEEWQIKEVQNRLIQKLLNDYNYDLRSFHLDYSNYFTYIDSKNTRCILCKRGHNKQKRDDLRQFSLAMLTTSILQVPIVWDLYEGNVNDKTEFGRFVALVKQELTKLGVPLSEVTIVFDGGSNSEENFSDLGFHIICAHSLCGHKDLYDIDLDSYETVILSNGKERRAMLVKGLQFSGIQGTGVLTYSPALEEGQVTQMEKDIQSTAKVYEEIKERLANPRSRLYTDLGKRKKSYDLALKEAVEYNQKVTAERKAQEENGIKRRGKGKQEKKLPVWDEQAEMLDIVHKALIKKNYLAEMSVLTITKGNTGLYEVSWHIDEEKKTAYKHKYFGKKLICTDHKDWSAKEILDEYSDQECIENNIFRVSKDTDHFAIRPQYHWTDDKILVHTFLCLTAILIAEVLRMQIGEKGIILTKPVMLDRLAEIRDGWIFQDEKTVSRVMEKMDDPDMKKLWAVIEAIFVEKAEA